jgi:two-component system chemotaxis response regulator CheY
MTYILVVDDFDMWRHLASRILTEAGYQVTQAESGERAIRLAQSSLPDLVLTDLEMPHLNGVEMAQRLRALPNFKSVPILLLTTQELSGGCDDPPTPFVDGYVNKRRAVTELLECVKSHLK